MSQLLVQFGDIEPFLTSHEDLAPATRQKLLRILCDVTSVAKPKMELAVVVDVGEPFVKATYALEGDGPLAFQCYEIVTAVQISITTAHYPNVNAIALANASGDLVSKQQWMDYALSCVKPGLAYFSQCLDGPLKTSLTAFKAARLFNPQKINEMKPDSNIVESVSVFPFLNDPAII